MAFSIRPVTDEEIFAFRHLIYRVLGSDVPDDPAGNDRYVALLPAERTCAVFDGDTMIGTSGTFALQMSVPGGTAPVAGLTMVTVAPTHRRRGVLRRMVDAHLDAAEARGDAISALWASEAPIYGRFGYGIATELDRVSLESPGVEIADRFGTDELHTLEGEARDAHIPAIYESVRTQRAGMLERSETWWANRHFLDPVFRRSGASKLRYVVARREGVFRGYLGYRQRTKFTEAVPDGEVVIVELLAADPAAEASLLRFATQIDLHPRVTWENAPVDITFPWIASDYRRVKRHRVDAVWLRICDVPKALSNRSYSADGALCIRVTDPLKRQGHGTYRLVVHDGVGTCQRIDAPPDLEMDLAALGSLYFGGIAPPTLARAEQIRGSQDAITKAGTMFATRLAPWCAEIF